MDCRICGGGLNLRDEKFVCANCGYAPDPNTLDLEIKISPQELKSKLDKGEKILLVDVRPQEEHDVANIKGSFLLPMDELPSKFESLSRERQIVLYCHHGMRSLNAARFLVQKGFKNVRSLEGGINLWANLIDKSISTY